MPDRSSAKQPESNNREQIALLNDKLRQRLNGDAPNMVVLTRGVMAITDDPTTPENAETRLLELISNFDAFDVDNNPHGERDFGSLVFEGQPIFWKIDYYDLDLEGHSPNPSDPSVTIRILTIMLSAEY